VNSPEQSEVLNSYPYQKFVDFSYSEMAIFVTLCLGGFFFAIRINNYNTGTPVKARTD
jgi:hypothetical protein